MEYIRVQTTDTQDGNIKQSHIMGEREFKEWLKTIDLWKAAEEGIEYKFSKCKKSSLLTYNPK